MYQDFGKTKHEKHLKMMKQSPIMVCVLAASGLYPPTLCGAVGGFTFNITS